MYRETDQKLVDVCAPLQNFALLCLKTVKILYAINIHILKVIQKKKKRRILFSYFRPTKQSKAFNLTYVSGHFSFPFKHVPQTTSNHTESKSSKVMKGKSLIFFFFPYYISYKSTLIYFHRRN